MPPISCQWTAGVQAAIERDTTNPHIGAASLKVTVVGDSAAFAQVNSSCVTAVRGMYSASFWYRMGDVRVTSFSMLPGFWSSTDCTTGPLGGSGPAVVSPVTTNTWTQSHTISDAVPAGTRSVSINLQIGCGQAACPGA